MVSVIIFSVVILSLAGLAFQIAKRTTRATDQALRMARRIAGADRAVTIPYDSLGLLLKPDTIMSGPIRMITKYIVDSVSAVRKDVRVVVSTSVAGSRTDTLLITRRRVGYSFPMR